MFHAVICQESHPEVIQKPKVVQKASSPFSALGPLESQTLPEQELVTCSTQWSEVLPVCKLSDHQRESHTAYHPKHSSSNPFHTSDQEPDTGISSLLFVQNSLNYLFFQIHFNYLLWRKEKEPEVSSKEKELLGRVGHFSFSFWCIFLI